MMYSKPEDRRSTGVISARIRNEIISNVEGCIKKYPQEFPDKSSFLKRAILHFLRHYGFNKVRVLCLDARAGKHSLKKPIEDAHCVIGDEK